MDSDPKHQELRELESAARAATRLRRSFHILHLGTTTRTRAPKHTSQVQVLKLRAILAVLATALAALDTSAAVALKLAPSACRPSDTFPDFQSFSKISDFPIRWPQPDYFQVGNQAQA